MAEEGEKKFTPTQEKAFSKGWRPEKDWDGESDEWVDAREFNFRGELMARISEQSSILNNFKNQIAERDTTIKDMSAHHKNVAEIEYKKALKMLQDAKVEALDEGESETVVKLDDEIDDLKQKARRSKVPNTKKPIKDTTPPEVIDWLQKTQNKWYVNDPFLKSVADGIAKGIIQANPNTAPTRLLEQMDKKIREELPHRFDGNPSVNQHDTDDTTPSRKSGQKGKKLGMRDLDEVQKDVAKRYIKLGVMTLDEYIDDLKTIGEL